MAAAFPLPVRYSHGQFLGVGDFTDEQSYHIAAARRHNIGPHRWGIVGGLEVACQDEEKPSQAIQVIVRPGYAVDGYGRELVVTRSSVMKVDPALYRGQGIDRLEVWLAYRCQSTAAPPVSGISAESQGRQPQGRWDETPEILIKPARGGDVNPLVPEGVPVYGGGQTPETVQVDAGIDSGETLWPVFLGRVMIPPDEETPLRVDMCKRPYVGIVAREIFSPGGEARIVLGGDSDDEARRFSVFVRAGPGETATPAIELDASGHLTTHAGASVGGTLFLNGGRMEFSAPASREPAADNATAAEGWRMYRATGADGVEELRIEMPRAPAPQPDKAGRAGPKGADKDSPAEVAIGAWSEDDGKFKTSLTVASDGSVHIAGDLVVKGLINPREKGDQSEEVKDLTDRVELGAAVASLARKGAEESAEKQRQSIVKWTTNLVAKILKTIGLKKLEG